MADAPAQPARTTDASRCAQLVVTELLAFGVTEVVLAPGSRSAPLSYELFEADRIGLVRLHVRIDERTAGFLALGLAKASGAPVAVVTTSGTAAANLHPAVLEAWHSQVPLLAVTADRPRAARHAGGNQTTDQTRLFGGHVRAETQLEDRPVTPRSWRFELARVLTAATGARTGQSGPAHLNISFSEPLTPGNEMAPTQPELRVSARRWAPDPWPLEAGPQTVLVAGCLPPDRGRELQALAEAAGVPLLADPSSNARAGSTAMSTQRLLLGSALADDIERVVLFGRPNVSRPVSRLLARDDIDLIVVAEAAEWIDPGCNAQVVADAVTLEPTADDWLHRWQTAEAGLRARLDELLAGQRYLTGPGLAARLWAELGPSDTFVVGSSNPIRDLDLAPLLEQPPDVYANRGLSGIDGTVSTAVGVALAVERPVHALLGDLTLLHDSTGLVIGPSEPRPDLRIVVANDDGGSIFATLEHGHPTHSAAFERVFGTPHGVDLAALAAATGCGYRRIDDVGQVAEVLAEPPLGIELVEAKVDRRHRRTLNEQITALATTL